MEIRTIDSTRNLLTGEEQRYQNGHDANMRLSRTIVKFEGRPIYVVGLWDGLLLQCKTLIDTVEDVLIDANDSRLDISSPKLGFYQTSSGTFYAMRCPTRSQRQGVDVARLLCYDVSTGLFTRASYDMSVLRAFGKSIFGDFRKISEILDGQSGAFARTWAIRRTKSKNVWLLYHKTEAVGFFFQREREFKLQSDKVNKVRLNSLYSVLSKQNGEFYNVMA